MSRGSAFAGAGVAVMADPQGLPEILVVESHRTLADLVSPAVWRQSFHISFARSKLEALMALRERRIAVVMLDLPGEETADMVQRLRLLVPQARVLAVFRDAQQAAQVQSDQVQALLHPIDAARLLAAARGQELGQGGGLQLGKAPVEAVGADAQLHGLIGQSAAMAGLHKRIEAAAQSNATVFLTGESGTGKDLTAMAIHAASLRAKGPFVALDCGAIAPEQMESQVFGHLKGAFAGAIAEKPGAAQAADGGTLFLDEICEMALAVQTKFLRFLETSVVVPVGATKPRRVNLRIICATHHDPLEAVRRGVLREDLYYRLFVVPIHLPALRDRGADVIEIAQAALRRFGREEGHTFSGLDTEVMQIFARYSWPGNVRQLLNVMRSIAVLHRGGVVTRAMLPEALQDAPADRDRPLPVLRVQDLTDRPLAEVERLVIEAALDRHGGSVQQAARMLDLAPSTLYRKIGAWRREV